MAFASWVATLFLSGTGREDWLPYTPKTMEGLFKHAEPFDLTDPAYLDVAIGRHIYQ
ncbi:hypothetical protein EYZ11_000352 [Aspergillus tanneri]|uniref:Uncharacterized protein n=1 Tax=Aspergillus tanneri TaxID=1220188 RepID=A0A4V3UQS9_9EURO|nr:hypothetical protein EYZ11_000352 [Aspergillus tanneri]